ncbi:MAG TPA: SMI1/KNR4 family protein [Polyangiaceae bacterium]|nr:SMI1/KNR4 family protein [Polyangiaceae bacterium]
MALDDVYEYFRDYDKASFAVFACRGNEPSEEDLAAFEGVAGFGLPEEFREFTMSPLGGLYMEVREELWPRPKQHDVGPFWSFLFGLKVFGIAAGIPEWLDIRAQLAAFRAEADPASASDLVPFLQIVDDRDRWCFDRNGQIVRWRHDAGDPVEPERISFSELLMREIKDLVARKDRKLRGEDRA